MVQGGAAAEKETILELSRHDKMPLVADFTRFLKRQRIENQTDGFCAAPKCRYAEKIIVGSWKSRRGTYSSVP